MANLVRHLTSISPELRSGPSPGRRLLAVVLCAMLVLGATFPGIAAAGEADSEGEGTTPTVEVPVGSPDFDPGGEETDLEEEAPAEGEEEGGAVEAEVETEAPAPEGVTGAAPVLPEATPPVASPEPPVYAPEAEATQQETQPPEPAPVEGQAIVAPEQKQVESGSASAASAEAAPPAEPAQQQEAPPPSPRPVAATPADPGRSLAGKGTYVVRPGDCLWQIAADLLGPSADTQAIEGEVARLWRLNEDRIGTGDPSLIYAGTELRLR